MTAAPTTRASIAGAWTVTLGTVVVGGTMTLFLAFLFAYGFQDHVGLVQHIVFLVLLTSSTVGLGVLGGSLSAALLSVPVHRGIRFGVAVSTAAHLAALALGTCVSLANEDQNSVTADQADWPFVVVVVLALLGSVVSARWASPSLRGR